MQSAEFKASREALSLTTAGLASYLGVSEPTIKNWERGKYSPPNGVAAEMRELEAYTRKCAETVADMSRERPYFLAYRLTGDMPEGKARTLGAGWWRAVGYRARQIQPALTIGYPEEIYEVAGTRESVERKSITPAALSL